MIDEENHPTIPDLKPFGAEAAANGKMDKEAITKGIEKGLAEIRKENPDAADAFADRFSQVLEQYGIRLKSDTVELLPRQLASYELDEDLATRELLKEWVNSTARDLIVDQMLSGQTVKTDVVNLLNEAEQSEISFLLDRYAAGENRPTQQEINEAIQKVDLQTSELKGLEEKYGAELKKEGLAKNRKEIEKTLEDLDFRKKFIQSQIKDVEAKIGRMALAIGELPKDPKERYRVFVKAILEMPEQTLNDLEGVVTPKILEGVKTLQESPKGVFDEESPMREIVESYALQLEVYHKRYQELIKGVNNLSTEIKNAESRLENAISDLKKTKKTKAAIEKTPSSFETPEGKTGFEG